MSDHEKIKKYLRLSSLGIQWGTAVESSAMAKSTAAELDRMRTALLLIGSRTGPTSSVTITLGKIHEIARAALEGK